ncbi:MAG TPA: BON domain-containing protein [Bryobacteraceae bacterium]|nr:BON domain-containing protein [Bryobacteraceae bacterium]
MRVHRVAGSFALACLLSGSAFVARAQDSAKAPDNTAVNKRDRRADEVTADQQKENSSDREIARKIRRAVVEDKNLSTYAHNVKIVVHNGAVTLKGPVHSEEEKRAIEAKAAEVAGADKVTNRISVKGDKAEGKS